MVCIPFHSLETNGIGNRGLIAIIGEILRYNKTRLTRLEFSWGRMSFHALLFSTACVSCNNPMCHTSHSVSDTRIGAEGATAIAELLT
jgi:hypothetical protein